MANGVVVFEGDSITATFSGYPQQSIALASFPDVPTVYDLAVSGSVMSDAFARAATVDAKYNPASGYNILVFLMGANDLRGEGWSQFISQVNTYLTARRTRGWKILVLPVLPQKTQEGFPLARTNTNAALKTDALIDYYVDAINNDPHMGCALCAFPPTLYYGTDPLPHPTALGQTTLAPYVAAGLTQLSGGIPVPPAQVTGVSAIATISWAAVPFAQSYNVKGSAVSGGPYALIGNTASTSLPISTSAYRYIVVSAVNQFGEGPNSAEMVLY